MENNTNKPEKHPFVSGKWLKNIPLTTKPAEWIIDEEKNFAYIPNKNIESIFLGSFPTFEVSNYNRHNNNKEFFYGSSRNSFWDILSYLTDIKINAEKNYFEILKLLNIGITDILKSTCRYNNGSADMDLYNINYNNFLQLKETYFPNLKNIFFTSGGKGKINKKDKNVASWFADYYFNHNKPIYNESNDEVNDNAVLYLLSKNDLYTQYGFKKKIENLNLISLISPSPQANISIQGILNKTNNFNQPKLNPANFRMLQWLYFIKKESFLNDNEIPEKISNIYENYIKNNPSLLKFFDEQQR